MAKRAHTLDEKFDLAVERQLLTGTQAIVRLMLMQKARDKAAGLDTGGYVTGYRGSPIATLEGAFQRAEGLINANDIVFHPGLNEDLAATAVWGTQQAELRGEGKYDGVFALWYGKGPGVDRTGDAFRHANHAGTSKNGGVVALLGDDHTCESSTSAHQSEFAMVDFMIPVLNPAGVQELIDFGLYGFALSRYAGVWASIKCVKDNIEATASVDGSIERVDVKIPADFVMPADGGEVRQLTTDAAVNGYPSWSPNGRCVVYTSEAADNRDLWLMDVSGAAKRRLTTHPGFDGDPIWHPGGGQLLFSTDRFGGQELALLRLDDDDAGRCDR